MGWIMYYYASNRKYEEGYENFSIKNKGDDKKYTWVLFKENVRRRTHEEKNCDCIGKCIVTFKFAI